MNNAVSDYRSGKICPPYWDLPKEPRLPEFYTDPKIADAFPPPGTGIGDIIPAQPYQQGVNSEVKQDVYPQHFVSRPARYFPAALLTRRRQTFRKRTRRTITEQRNRRATFIYWPPAPVGRHTNLPWGGVTQQSEPYESPPTFPTTAVYLRENTPYLPGEDIRICHDL